MKATFILKTNKHISKENYEQLVEIVSDFSHDYDMYLDEVFEEPLRKREKR